MEKPIENEYNKKEKDNDNDKFAKMWERIKESIKRYYPSNIKKIPSLGSIAKEYKMHRNTVRKYILINLEKEIGHDSTYHIFSEIWHKNLKMIKNRYSKFMRIIDDQFERHYPKEIESILGINAIRKEIGASKISIIEWCKGYLKNKFGEEQSEEIYEKIWGYKFALKNKYQYETIKEFMNRQKGYLLSTKEEWREMEEVPSERYVKVGHLVNKKHHIWMIKVRYLINQSRWCPECNDNFCENVLKLYMNKILGVYFRPTTLRKAFGVKVSSGGLLKYDMFNENVLIEGSSFKIAAEYDGEQHDVFPNCYHTTIDEFYNQKRRDRLKDDISIQNQTVLIRIKAVNGFHRNSMNLFQEEIIKQLNSHPFLKSAKVKIKDITKYDFNPLMKKLEVKNK